MKLIKERIAETVNRSACDRRHLELAEIANELTYALDAKQRECDDLTIRLAEEKLLVGSKDVEIERLRLACRLPLIFHGGGQWAWEQQNEWANIIKTLIPSSDNLEATTKNMCDAIRAAMTKGEGKV